jgi:hypothetical protein
LSEIPNEGKEEVKAIGFGKDGGEESSIGLANLAMDEASHSIREIEQFKKKAVEGAGVKGGIAEVIEIDDGIVGVDPLTKKDKKKILFAGKEKKKKKKKSKSDSEEEEAAAPSKASVAEAKLSNN